MTGTNATVDGMGFEEVEQLVTNTSYALSSYFSGAQARFDTVNSVITNADTIGTGGMSFTTYISGNNIRLTGSYIDANTGRLRSVLLGSATTNVWGGFIQAGSFTTDAGSQGFVKFGTPYSSSSSYYVTVTPCGSSTTFEQSYISGTRNASGINFVGAASLRYDWLATGI